MNKNFVRAGEGKGGFSKPRPASPIKAVDRERAIFNQLHEKYAKDASGKGTGVIVTPGFLRIEKKIVNGQSKYEFIATRDTNSDTVTENKLDRNDKFLVTHLGLFLMKRLSTLIGHEILQTYPNPTEFADSSTNFIGRHLEAIYNGRLGVKVGQTNYIEALDTRRFRYVPTAQEYTFSTVSEVKNSGATENSGFIALTPQIELDGDVKTIITLDAPIASNHKVAHVTSNTDNFLVLVGRGFLITNR